MDSIPGSGWSPGEGIAYQLQYSWAPLVAQLVKNPPGFNSWVGKSPWRRERLPTPVFRPGEFHGLCSPSGRRESDMTEWLSLSLSPFPELVQRTGQRRDWGVLSRNWLITRWEAVTLKPTACEWTPQQHLFFQRNMKNSGTSSHYPNPTGDTVRLLVHWEGNPFANY